MESSRLDRVQIDVAGEIVEIAWKERDTLLRRLRAVAGCEKVVQHFEAVGASRPVQLDDEQRSRLRVTLELWATACCRAGSRVCSPRLFEPIRVVTSGLRSSARRTEPSRSTRKTRPVRRAA